MAGSETTKPSFLATPLHRNGRKQQVSVMALAAILSATSLPVMAQAQTDQEDITEVIVTGVRAGINRSIAMKRRADSVVDGISAEDIGKFPDANIAESLQRIPGVSIDRSGGEGRYVSINGLGPEFANVLVNGRAIANDNPDRSFSFDTLASELISSVSVYKSANARIREGGIGGTIDVVTARPFDYKAAVFSGSISAQHESNSNRVSPQVSFVVSNRFLDDRLGVLASFTRQERHNRTYITQNSAIIENLFFDADSYAYVSDDLDEAWRMQDLTRTVQDDHRERTGGSVAVQYQATPNLLLTADYIYSKFNISTRSNSASNWFWAVMDTDRNVIDENGTYTTFDHAVGLGLTGYAYIHDRTERPTETQMLGFNALWTPTDRLTVKFDTAWSEAINNNRGLDQSHALEILFQEGFLVHSDGGVPYMDLDADLAPSDANMPLLRARQSTNSGNYIESQNREATLDLSYRFTDRVRLDFGGGLAIAKKENETWQTPLAIRRLYHANATGQQIDTASIISGIYNPRSKFGNDRLDGAMYLIDSDALRAWMADPVNLANRTRNATAGGLAEFNANGRSWNAVKTGDSYSIEEETTSFYGDLHLDLALGNMPLEVVAGIRYAETKLTSHGQSQILTDLFVAEGETTGILSKQFADGGVSVVSVNNKYSNWLPSLNAKLELRSDMILRMAVSKTLTRPSLESLAPSMNIGSTFIVARNAVGSNPNLKPFLSTNFDLSYEWYYNRNGTLAVAYYHKDVKDYIIRAVGVETIDTVATPEYRTFNVTRPRNAEQAKIDGATIAWTHALENGFGFQANYTKVKSNATLGKDTSVSFALPGLSDTLNIVAFYEKGPLGARIAYNWRDAFLASVNYGGTTQPRYFTAYEQLDARVSYGFDNGFTLSLEATNLTNEKVNSHGRYENQFISYGDYGRRVSVGLSKRF